MLRARALAATVLAVASEATAQGAVKQGLGHLRHAREWPTNFGFVSRALFSTDDGGTPPDTPPAEEAAPTPDAQPSTSDAADLASRPGTSEAAGPPLSADPASTSASGDAAPAPAKEFALPDTAAQLLEEIKELAAEAGLAAELDAERMEAAVKAGDTSPEDLRVCRAYLEARAFEKRAATAPGTDSFPTLNAELAAAVREQYGQFGLSPGELREYLDVALDIEDALAVGEMPRLSTDRHAVYRRVHELLHHGPEKSKEDQEYMQAMVEQDVLEMPWPSTLVREFMREKGAKLRRLKRTEQTRYDQGFMTEAMFPFESEEDLISHLTKTPHAAVPTTYWGSELDDEGNIQRTSRRAVGTTDMSDWARLVTSAQQARAAPGKGGSGEGGGGGDVVDQHDVAADVVLKAAFRGQEATILRRHGFEPERRDEFLEEVGLSAQEWAEWVQHEVDKQIELFHNTPKDERSPEDMFEQLLPEKQLIEALDEPVYNLRELASKHEHGPLSDNFVFPEFLLDPSRNGHPAAEAAFAKHIVDEAMQEGVVPDIFRFKQTLWLHLGHRPYHPGNRSVTLHVYMHDLQNRYGLSPEAVAHIIQVAAKRYNPRTGELKISCRRHRMREDNRRQAMHWMLKLVESALLEYPSEDWEAMKQRQAEYMQSLPADVPAAQVSADARE